MLYLQTGANRERNHQDELRVEELKGHQLSLFLKKFSNFLERMHLCLLYAIQFPETLNVTLKITVTFFVKINISILFQLVRIKTRDSVVVQSVAKTLCSQSRGPGFNPWLGN